jgi:hypothetical protein
VKSVGEDLKSDPVVIKVQKGLVDIRPLIGLGAGAEISDKTVHEINAIAEELVRTISAKGNGNN